MTGRLLRATGLVLAVSACAETPDATAPPGRILPLASEAERGRFLLGRAVFDRLTTEDEGLGPLYNGTRCSSCHDTPVSGGSGPPLVRKATRWADDRCDLLESVGGDNIQQLATAALTAQGITGEVIPPEATDSGLAAGPSLFGLGLVEAIPDATILSHADPDDTDGNGVSGRPGREEGGSVGRFGRKAEILTVAAFVETALRFELGLTTSEHPVEESVNGVPIPDGTDPMPEPEIDDRGRSLLSDYIRFLAAPPRAVPEGAEDDVARGEALFASTGCADCHIPTMRTGPNASPALNRRDVSLYSDLLLHDMGPALADVCGTGARPSEWRTARLWGLRFRTSFLHDGRAPDAETAVRLHDGEAAAARDAFAALSEEQRAALLLFLGSI